MPILQKPQECGSCPLASIGQGFSLAVGPTHAPMAFIAEALGEKEVYAGHALVGPAGELFNKALRRAGIDRNAVRLHNVISCRPPENKLVGMYYEQSAIAHCRQYLEPILNEPHKVFVALGATATRSLLDLPKQKFKINDWHGYPTWHNGRWVVPTFHPSHLLQGAHNLLGTVLFDLTRAKMVASGEWEPDEPELIVDPPIDWFRAWADEHIALARKDPVNAPWLVIDTETVEKMTGAAEDELKGEQTVIVRVNFSNNPDLGITVPFSGAYIPIVKELCECPGTKIIWNERYDIPLLKEAGIEVAHPVLDMMIGWHMLQSDLPKGLGYVAPFYSKAGAWKHTSVIDPGPYAAKDGPQTLRCAFGIAKNLQQFGMWDSFYRHVYLMDTYVLRPAEEAGVPMSRDRLVTFKDKLEKEQRRLREEIQQYIPEEVRKEEVWKTERGGTAAGATAVTRREVVQVCDTCGATEVSKTHNCRMGTGPSLNHREADVCRWVRREPFNPGSRDQVAAYIKAKGYKIPGRQKKTATGKTSVNKKVVAALSKSTKDPAFSIVSQHSSVAKVKGNYAVGSLNRLDEQGYLHPNFLHNPSTMRLSCVDPNIQNVVADRGGADQIASGFRLCVVAPPGFKLIEIDYSGIEAVLTGWFAHDPAYIRLAKLGVHAYLASHLIGEPADLRKADAELAAYFDAIKAKYEEPYNRAKRCVHGTNYGMTPNGLVNNYPEYFTLKTARETQALLFEVCPRLKDYQNEARTQAARDGFVGGGTHPYRYRHWFWNVYNYSKASGGFTLGEDAKRVVAFKPQSTAYGVLAEACVELCRPDGPNSVRHLGGSKGFPIRALIHDSTLALVPDENVEIYIQRSLRVMEAPITALPVPAEWNMGKYLTVGAEVKVGQNWAPISEANPDGMKKVKVNRAAESAVHDVEEEDEEWDE